MLQKPMKVSFVFYSQLQMAYVQNTNDIGSFLSSLPTCAMDFEFCMTADSVFPLPMVSLCWMEKSIYAQTRICIGLQSVTLNQKCMHIQCLLNSYPGRL